MARHPFPTDPRELEDLRSAISKFVLPGYVPEKPIFPRSAWLMTMGSCFAETVHNALVKNGINSTHLFLSETINTPPFARITMERILGNDVQAIGHLGPDALKEDSLVQIRNLMPHVSGFILTLGGALQAFHSDGLPLFYVTKSLVKGGKDSLGGDFWRMLSVAEVVDHTRALISGLRRLCPQAPIILTLSPIPLANSLIHPSVFSQDCISKSNLRAAIAMVVDEGLPGVAYWPSFEIVRWLGAHAGPFYGTDGVDQRHVSPRCIDLITGLFIEHFFEDL